ncbi:phosphopantetheine-binding protein [Bacillus cereus]
MENFPLNANGKIERNKLPDPLQEHLIINSQYVMPRTHVEKKLVSIWNRRLGVERIGIQDNFFELGGHSLLAVQITADINKEFQTNMQVKLLFENPTIEGISNNIQEGKGKLRLKNLLIRLIEIKTFLCQTLKSEYGF